MKETNKKEKVIDYILNEYKIDSKSNDSSVESYYNESIKALIGFMIENEVNPNEKTWNRLAVNDNYLSAETIGYIYELGFNKLCRNIRKDLNKYKNKKFLS